MSQGLQRTCSENVCFWADPELESALGVRIAFSERQGGTSGAPFDSLNLAAHVGDVTTCVDENRTRLLGAMGLSDLRDRLVMAEQVHGADVASVDTVMAGAGAFGSASSPPPVSGVDALVTTSAGIPLLLLFADCVPLVLVTSKETRGVAVAHAGWRGLVQGVHIATARRLCAESGCEPSDLLAYVGPYACGDCFEVGPEVLSHLPEGSATIARVPGRVDLGAWLSVELEGIGVRHDRIAMLERCTIEQHDEFFSYRADRTTGRHGALAVILEGPQ